MTAVAPERCHVSWETYNALRREVGRLQAENVRLQAECDHWYVASRYTREQIADMRRRASLTGKQIDWTNGVIV